MANVNQNPLDLTRYEIRVEGRLDERRWAWFEALQSSVGRMGRR